MPDIVMKDLCKSYGSVTAVSNITLEIGDGEFFVLLGPSGAGKSTIINIFTGMINPDSGSVTIGEKTIAGPGVSTPPRKRGISAVFQDGGLWPHMNVLRHLMFVLEGKIDKKDAKKRAEEYLEMVKLTGKEARFPHQLSGGERQRLALARALVIENSCLLLDEPFANLDRPLVIGLIDDILKLHKELGLTTFFVTHQQEDALFLATRMGMMRNGKILQVETPTEIYYSPSEVYVAKFFGDNNILPCTVSGDELVTILGPVGAKAKAQGELVWCVRPSSITASRDGAGIEAALVGSDFKGDYWIGRFVVQGIDIRVNMGAQAPAPGRYRLSVTGRHILLPAK